MNEQIWQYLVVPMAQIATIVGIMLGCVMYLVLWERKLIAFMQVRMGPMRVGYHGLLQPLADVFKLLLKEDVVPDAADGWLHRFAPMILMIPALACFAVIPFTGTTFELPAFTTPIIHIDVPTLTITPWVADLNVGLLYFLAISSLGVYGLVLAGWASNSKYSMLGAMRSAAQMISYEVPLGLSVVAILMLSGSASLVGIVTAQQEAGHWFLFWAPFGVPLLWPQFIGLFLYFIAAVAETNRAPFDLPEAETELVAGFHTEYSGMKFAFMFLAEYLNMILSGLIVAVLFLGGWMPITFGIPGLAGIFSDLLSWLPFVSTDAGVALTGFFWLALKVFLVLTMYLWLRATFPRYRYDQLMRLGWKWLIPMGLFHVLLTAVLMLARGA
jgi:NADH-quinone oxidoreductase subunit H